MKNCENNFLISFKVPITKIDIANYDSKIRDSQKLEILIDYTLQALVSFELREKDKLDNPIIMLKRDCNVPGTDIKKIWQLKEECGYMTPIFIDNK